jgi:hypothetical protein
MKYGRSWMAGSALFSGLDDSDLRPALHLPGHGEPLKTDTVKEIID